MQLADAFFPPYDRLLIVVFAILVNSVLMRESLAARLAFVTPYRMGAGLMGGLEQRLNRSIRGQSALKTRGLLSLATLLLCCMAFGIAADIATRRMPHGEIVQMLLVCLALGVRAPFDTCWQLLGILKQKTPLPPYLLSGLAHPGADAKDEHSLIRAGMETLFTRYAVHLAAPVFWYALAGMPGLTVCACVTLAEQNLRARGLHGALFGTPLRLVYQLLHYIPSRLAGLLLVLASVFIPSCHPVHAAVAMLAESRKLRTTPFGWVLGALAGALTLALAGPRSHYLLLRETPWVGGGSARATMRDLARAMFLYGIALQLLLLSLALALYCIKYHF